METHRKRPLRLIWEIGPLALVRVLLGMMNAEQAFTYLSRKAGAVIRHVELPIAEAAVDVDKPADLELVERIFQRSRATSTSSWSDLVRPSTSLAEQEREVADELVDGRAKRDHDG